MRAVLNKIFLRKLGLGKFILSAIAFLVGFSLVLLALQGYVKIKDAIAPKKNESNFVIINKEVSLVNTLFGAKSQFSPEEIKDLKQQPFVDDLGIFKSGKFQASAHLGGELGFYTELFFESVPSQFIDNAPSDFSWEEGENFLPIIISQDFLNLYNFGFAVGKGLPQLSKSTIQMVPLTVVIDGPLGRDTFHAKVVGFSDRISSILVPDKFITWANKSIGNSNDQSASRAIIKLKSDQAPAFDAYLQKNHLKVSDEKLRFGKILAAMNIVMSVLVFMGTAFMIFALIIVMMNFSLMVAQAKEEVSLLLQLGYKAKHLTQHLSRYLIIFMASIVFVSAFVFALGNYFLVTFLEENGMSVTRSITTEVVLLGIGFVMLSLAVSYYSIRRLIRKQI